MILFMERVKIYFVLIIYRFNIGIIASLCVSQYHDITHLGKSFLSGNYLSCLAAMLNSMTNPRLPVYRGGLRNQSLALRIYTA
ncbi:UNVERIFIED_CONTAM: hypothetical protein GTU68_047839 [Idotea baltica]|nr:hypothetical protein [Idotea baltica]